MVYPSCCPPPSKWATNRCAYRSPQPSSPPHSCQCTMPSPLPAPPSQLPLPSQCTMPGTHSDMCIVRVRRTRLVEDALSEVSRQLKKDLFKPLRVHFIGEEGIDAGEGGGGGGTS